MYCLHCSVDPIFSLPVDYKFLEATGSLTCEQNAINACSMKHLATLS